MDNENMLDRKPGTRTTPDQDEKHTLPVVRPSNGGGKKEEGKQNLMSNMQSHASVQTVLKSSQHLLKAPLPDPSPPPSLGAAQVQT